MAGCGGACTLLTIGEPLPPALLPTASSVGDEGMLRRLARTNIRQNTAILAHAHRPAQRVLSSVCRRPGAECETAMDISALSFYSHEKESLLAPGTQLEVISRKRNGKITEIHVKV